jgi:Uma2 family endonuclease
VAVAALKHISEEEYLALEIDAEEKHEYLDGRIFAMAGGSPEHALISSNVGRALGNLSGDGPCRVYSSDLRVKVEATGLNTYPDVTVACGELRRTTRKPQAATNPTIIVEVLSDMTREYDRGEKWRHYQALESLTDYVLVWQNKARVEHYARIEGGAWAYRLFEGLDKSLRIDSLDGDLSLAEVYRGVEFPETPVLR